LSTLAYLIAFEIENDRFNVMQVGNYKLIISYAVASLGEWGRGGGGRIAPSDTIQRGDTRMKLNFLAAEFTKEH